MDYPITNKTFVRHHLTPDGLLVGGLESIYFIWHPWGIETAVRWLRRLEKHQAPPEAHVQARRVLGHLVVDLGDDAVRRILPGVPFAIAETVYALASVPPP